MLNLGCHLTSSKGYEFMARQALNIKADTFQFFTRNPRGGKAKEIDPEDVKRFLEIASGQSYCSTSVSVAFNFPLARNSRVRIVSSGTPNNPAISFWE